MYEAAGVACDNREFPRVPDSCNNTVCLLPGEDKQGNVFYHGLSVCDDDWGWTQAQIICKERGYKTGIPTKESKFGPVPRNFVKILCQGGEARLEDCAKTRINSCDIEVRNTGQGIFQTEIVRTGRSRCNLQ